MLHLPQQVHTALSMLAAAGYEAYIVGGCVRDALLGCTPQDYDIATNALPDEVAAVFRAHRVIETGLKHGTVTVLLIGLPIEVTTYRVDLGYSDGRHPDRVEFTPKLRDDLARRDFTINAMAYHPERGLIDCFGGQADLAAGLLRCVGVPETRFSEDALRILRLLRFAAKLGFAVEERTAEAAFALRSALQKVSAERIQKELTGLLLGANAGDVLIQYVDVFGVFLPELLTCKNFLQHNPHHRYDVLTHLAKTVDALPSDPVLRLAGLLHDIGKPVCFTMDENGVGHFYSHAARSADLAEQILTRLRYDNETKRQVVALVAAHDRPIEPNEQAVKRALNRLTPALFSKLLALKRADCVGQGLTHPERMESYDRMETIAERLFAEQACFSLRELAVNGDDLLRAGVPQGKQIGQTLRMLLDAVIDGGVANEKTALLTYLKHHVS